MKLSSMLSCFTLALALGGAAQAQYAPQQQRGYVYYAPGRSTNQNSLYRNNLLQPRAFPTQTAQAPADQAVANRQQAPSRAARGWSVQPVVGYGYPASLFGQFAQPPGFGQGPSYAPPEVAQGAAPQGPPSAGIPGPGPGAPQAAPGYPPAGSAPAPQAGGISSIYAYSGRYPGPYYGYGVPYYGYGGCCGWGSPYNSAYYTTGCYAANACCRAPRRFCTPFGGMGYGCGSGCYVMTPPPCPTVCDPCGPGAAVPPGAPPAGGVQPQPGPPMPNPELETPPQPVEPKVKPAPQASIFPKIPNMPET